MKAKMIEIEKENELIVNGRTYIPKDAPSDWKHCDNCAFVTDLGNCELECVGGGLCFKEDRKDNKDICWEEKEKK